MAEINATTAGLAKPLTEVVDVAKFDPTATMRVIQDNISTITGKQVDFVDPTNPFIMLLESANVLAASANNESLSNLRAQYPSLATTFQDLHYHMSDSDYIDQNAIPAKASIYILLKVSDLKQFAEPVPGVPVSTYSRVTIPRNTQITVTGDTVFSIEYPINIDVYPNNIVVTVDTEVKSPTKIIDNYIIPTFTKSDAERTEWLVFPLEVEQFFINTTQHAVSTGTTFDVDIPTTDKFYYARVFQKNATLPNVWQELAVTHSEMVFDPLTPTAVLKVNEDSVDVTIPSVYLSSGIVTGNIRVDIYETKGNIFSTLVDLPAEAYAGNFLAIDTARDSNVYTAALAKISKAFFSNDVVSGGRDALSFEELRQRVIHRTVGPIDIPITEESLIAKASNNGFDLYKSEDVISDRTYLAHRWLPTLEEINDPNLSAAIELTREELVITPNDLATKPNVYKNNNRLTMLSGSVFRIDNGFVTVLDTNEIAYFNSLTKEAKAEYVNLRSLYFTPFTYVFDLTSNSLDVKAYDIDTTSVDELSIEYTTTEHDIRVDVSTVSLTRTPSGYTLTVTVLSDDNYKAIPDADVGIALKLSVSNSVSFITVFGTLISLPTDPERVFQFNLTSNFDIDEYDGLALTNTPSTGFSLFVDIINQVTFYMFTTSAALPSAVDPKAISINNEVDSGITPNLQVLTKEAVKVTLGTPLKHLWTRSRMSYTERKYKTYPNDVPAFYENDVYKLDPATGAILVIDSNCDVGIEVLHHKGDPILDTEGQPVIRYRKGDVILDYTGSPTIDLERGINIHMEAVLIDYTFAISTDSHYTAHLETIIALLRRWATVDMKELNKRTLELTTVQYAPIAKSGSISVSISDNTVVTLPAKYSPSISLYLEKNIASNAIEVNSIRKQVTSILVNYLRNRVVSLSELQQLILTELQGVLRGVQISDLNPINDYELVKALKEDERFSINKKSIVDLTGNLITGYDVSYETVTVA